MTSRTLSLNLLKGELKRKIWLYTLTLLAFLAIQPGSLLMEIDRYVMWGFRPEQIAANVRFALSISNLALTFLAVAVFYGFVIFGYLFSRSKVDLYHSLPIKRENQFLVRFISGIVPFALIEILASLLEILVLTIKGYNGYGLEPVIFNTAVYAIIEFALCFSITIIALTLTGNPLIGLMICAAVMAGKEFISLIIGWYKSYCLQTYSYCSEPTFSWWDFILAPSRLDDNLPATIGQYPSRFVVFVIEVVILTVAAMYLYKIRPSESAGKGVCYKIMQPVLRIPTVIVAALAGGIYLVFVSGEFMTAGWYWSVFILVGVLTHIILEIVLQLDFKKALKHWPQLIVSLAVAAVIACFFLYDLSGYDRYIPEESKVSNYAVALDNIDSDMSFVEDPAAEEIVYVDRDRYIIEHMKSAENTAVRQLADIGVANIDPERSVFKRTEKQRELNYMSYEEWAEKYGIDPDEMKVCYTVGYTLKGGRMVWRTYQASLPETYASVEAVYDSEAYREAAYQIDEMTGKGLFKKIEFSDATYDTAFSLSEDDVDGFLEAYNKDLKAMTLKQIAEAYPLYQMTSVSDNIDLAYMDLTYGYYVYPSFVNSINYLKSKGAEIDTEIMNLDPKRIEHVEITDYSSMNEGGYQTYATYGVAEEEPEQLVYDSEADFEVIKELCDVAILDHFAYVNNIFKPYEDNLEVCFYYQTDKGFVNSYYVKIPKGRVPARVAADLEGMK